MKNPFHTEILEPDQPFCNRVAELEELANHARNGMNVVLFAPRRYGKTSLVSRVQHQLRGEGMCVIYAQFLRLISVEDLVHRLAKAIITGLHEHESLLDKGKRWVGYFRSIRVNITLDPTNGMPSIGVQLAEGNVDPIVALETVLEEIGGFLKKEDFHVCIALDEFQDIVDIKDPRVEALLREHIQRHRASYIFLGSRRRVLLDIFNNHGRPFYQSATMMELKPLPEEEAMAFIVDQFAKAGKDCPEDVALAIVHRVKQYPYYLQALAYRCFELCENVCRPADVEKAYLSLLENEAFGYQAILRGLTSGQVKLLRGIATTSGEQLTSSPFLAKYELTLGGVQSARKTLDELDLIEHLPGGSWGLVDPLFEAWLARTF